MNRNSIDPAVLAAVEAALGRTGPWRDEELAEVQGALHISHASDIALLAQLRGLKRLELVACEVRKLDALAGLESLQELSIVATPITRLDVLTRCPALTQLELLFTRAEDLSPLLHLPNLRRVRLLGNPWSPTSFRTGRYGLLTASAAGRAPLAEFSSTYDWDLTRELHGKGMKLGFATIDGLRPALVRSGLPKLAGAECDGVAAGPAHVKVEIRRAGASTDELLASLVSQYGALERSALISNRTLADANEMRRWVEPSPLPSDDRALLLRFIDRFPWLTFYRQGTEMLDRAASEHGVSIPNWLRAQHEVFAGIAPNSTVFVQFDTFDEGVYNEERLLQGWYSLDLFGYSNSDDRELLHDRCGVFPVGIWNDTNASSVLAISVVDPNDRAIHQFNPDYLWDALAEGRPLEEHITPVFRSYASMLSHVKSIRLDDLDSIPASPS